MPSDRAVSFRGVLSTVRFVVKPRTAVSSRRIPRSSSSRRGLSKRGAVSVRAAVSVREGLPAPVAGGRAVSLGTETEGAEVSTPAVERLESILPQPIKAMANSVRKLSAWQTP